MTEYYSWFVFLHVFGAFAFAAAHGASAILAFRIRASRDPAAVRVLLEASQVSIGAMYGGLLLLLIGGIVAGIVGNHFGRGWIWAALVLLVLTMFAMYALATPYYGRLRAAVGAQGREQPGGDAAAVATPGELEALVRGNRPVALLAVGLAGFVVILWLMILKPF